MAKVVNGLFGGTWRIAEFSITNCQLEFEGCRFFTYFQQDFRKSNPIAFETIMVLVTAHMFGFYNPKQLADYLNIPHQGLYLHLKDWSLYHLKKMLLGFMVKQADEELSPVSNKSDATRSRSGITLSIDNSVIDRL